MEPAIALVVLVVVVLAGFRLARHKSWWAIVPAALAVGWMAGICVLSQP